MIFHRDSTKWTSAWWAVRCNVPKFSAGLFTGNGPTWIAVKANLEAFIGFKLQSCGEIWIKELKEDRCKHFMILALKLLWYGIKWSKVNTLSLSCDVLDFICIPLILKWSCLFVRQSIHTKLTQYRHSSASCTQRANYKIIKMGYEII